MACRGLGEGGPDEGGGYLCRKYSVDEYKTRLEYCWFCWSCWSCWSRNTTRSVDSDDSESFQSQVGDFYVRRDGDVCRRGRFNRYTNTNKGFSARHRQHSSIGVTRQLGEFESSINVGPGCTNSTVFCLGCVGDKSLMKG